VFEWTALKNLSHRYDGQLGDSYSNCLRLAIVQGYEHYGKVGGCWPGRATLHTPSSSLGPVHLHRGEW
jgi:hypothetical protein